MADTKTVAHPKTLADAKTLAHGKILAPTEMLAHRKNYKTVRRIWMIGSVYWRPRASLCKTVNWLKYPMGNKRWSCKAEGLTRTYKEHDSQKNLDNRQAYTGGQSRHLESKQNMNNRQNHVEHLPFLA